MKGSSKLMKQFFDEYGRPPVPRTGKIDWHMFSEKEKSWFFDRGCTWHKGKCPASRHSLCRRSHPDPPCPHYLPQSAPAPAT